MEKLNENNEGARWAGRQEAFLAVATECSAARALCLKQARESRVFEPLGITWDEYCKRYVGISRSSADGIIRHYEEFGESYFRLSDLAPISAETFRLLARDIRGGALEIEGEPVPLTPEHAPKIRAAIKAVRARHRKERPPAPLLTPEQNEANADFWARFQDLLADLRRAAQAATNSQGRWELSYLAQDAAKSLLQFANEVRADSAA